MTNRCLATFTLGWESKPVELTLICCMYLDSSKVRTECLALRYLRKYSALIALPMARLDMTAPSNVPRRSRLHALQPYCRTGGTSLRARLSSR